MLSTLRQAIYVQPYVCALPGVVIFITSHVASIWSATGCAGHGCRNEVTGEGR